MKHTRTLLLLGCPLNAVSPSRDNLRWLLRRGRALHVQLTTWEVMELPKKTRDEGSSPAALQLQHGRRDTRLVQGAEFWGGMPPSWGCHTDDELLL